MPQDEQAKRQQRLERAKRFLAAGRTAIETGPNPTGPNKGGSGKARGVDDGPDPTRYGDWEKNGRCIDF